MLDALLEWSFGTRTERLKMDNQNQVCMGEDHDHGTVGALAPTGTKRKRGDSEGPITFPEKDRPIKHTLAHLNKTASASGGTSTVRGMDWLVKEQRHEHAPQPIPTTNGLPVDSGAGSRSIIGSPLSSGFVQSKIDVVESSPPLVDRPTTTTLQELVESQFGLEILLKHKELRLIEQELAKCQTALDQLRRSQIIPYPASTSNPQDMQAVSSGIGLAHTAGFVGSAEYPSPWGIVEGPYSRHYAKWLISDPTFDGITPENSQTVYPQTVSERSTRGNKTERPSTVNQGRGQRGLAGPRLQALPAGYPEHKEEKGPMIVKRSTDGKMVKLVCLDCRRENFNSAQGFINHCRIAHTRGFASHDAAALACGEEVEYTESGAVVAESTGSAAASAGLVHYLIRSANPAALVPTPINSTPRQRNPQPPLRSSANTLQATQSPTIQINSPSEPTTSTDQYTHIPFVPSPSAPHLSALFAKAGRGGDLSAFVSQAQTETPLDNTPSDDEEPELPEPDTPLESPSHVHAGRLTTRFTTSPTRTTKPISSKGPTNPRRNPHTLALSQSAYASPYTTPTTSSQPTNNLSHRPSLLPTSPHALSPTTIETHPAPSLVSDDEDDYDEYEDPHSESENPSGAESDGERYLEVGVEDEMEGSVDLDLRAASHKGKGRRRLLSGAGMRRERRRKG